MRHFSSVFVVTVAAFAGILPARAADVTIDRDTEAFGRRYGITFTTVAPRSRTVNSEPLTHSDDATLKVYLRMFREEFGKYPPAFVQATRLKSIVLVKNMTVDGTKRGAVPDNDNAAVWYDPFRGDYDEMYQRHVIHHEFFHFADLAIHGPAYLTEPYWASLNRPDFKYGGGGHTARGGDQFGVTNREPGFVNRYATSGLEEDRAEIFASMWIPMEANILEQRSRADPILRGKIQRMRTMFRFFAAEPKAAKDKTSRAMVAAIGRGDVTELQKLAASDPATLHATDWLGRTVLHWAAMSGDAKRTAAVIALAGAEAAALVNAVDDDGWTPLHVASFLGDAEVVKVLLKNGAAVGVKDKRKFAARQWAAARGHQEVVELLGAAAVAR